VILYGIYAWFMTTDPIVV